MTARSIAHGSFTVERHYRHSPAKVFSAFANPEFKRQWFGAPEAGNPAHIFEFREGGREYSAGDAPNGNSYTFDVRYADIVPDNRIIYTYEMTMGAQRISVSVATIEMTPTADGTKLVVREDGAFLDGLDTSKAREEGTNFLIDQMGALLDRME